MSDDHYLDDRREFTKSEVEELKRLAIASRFVRSAVVMIASLIGAAAALWGILRDLKS